MHFVHTLHKKQSSFISLYTDQQSYLYWKIKKMRVSIRKKEEKQFYLQLLRQRQAYVHKLEGSFLTEEYHYSVSDHQISIESKFIRGITLKQKINSSRLLMKNIDHQFILGALKQTVDLLLRFQGCPQFIMTLQNVFVEDGGVLRQNCSSLVGMRLILFEQPIPAIQFNEIGLILDSNIFTRLPVDRINAKVKQRALCIIILTLICPNFSELTANIDKSQLINKQSFVDLIFKFKELMRKFLKSKQIKSKIKKFQQISKVNLVHLFQAILIDEQNLSWGQVISMIFSTQERMVNQQTQFVNEMCKSIAIYHWKSLSTFQKERLIKQKIVSVQSSTKQFLEKDLQIFLIWLLQVNFASVLSYPTIEQLLLSRQYNKLKVDLLNKFVKLIPINPKTCQIERQFSYQVNSCQSIPSHTNSNGQIAYYIKETYTESHEYDIQRNEDNIQLFLSLLRLLISKKMRINTSNQIAFMDDRAKGLNRYRSLLRQ